MNFKNKLWMGKKCVGKIGMHKALVHIIKQLWQIHVAALTLIPYYWQYQLFWSLELEYIRVSLARKHQAIIKKKKFTSLRK